MGGRTLLHRFRRGLITRSLSRLIEWTPLNEPVPGYTIVIGCVTELAGLAVANLKALGRCDLTGAVEILLVFDRPLDQVAAVTGLPESVSGIPVRVLGYSVSQDRAARRISWGWVYAWMSWSIGIAESRTRAVLLHDLDAMPLKSDLFLKLSASFAASGSTFQGVRPYSGNGFVEADGFVATYEMLLDASVLREKAKAIDAFSRFGKRDGVWVDYDTFLSLEERLGSCSICPVEAEDLFHPSQLLCQYTDHLNTPHRLPAGGGNLVLLPYLLYVGGAEEMFVEALAVLKEGGSSFLIRSKRLDISGANSEQVEWQRVQVERLETSLFQGLRPEVAEWLEVTGRAATAAPGTKR